MRRTLIVFLLLLAAVAIQAQPGKPEPAHKILSAAVEKAKASDKNVFLIFHASWCGWCKRLDAALDDLEVKEAIEGSYVVAYLDVLESKEKKEALENPGAEKNLTDLGGAKSGLPFYAVLDSTGTKIADSNLMPKYENIGYPASREEIAAFDKLLRQTGRHMTFEQRTQIIAYLEKHTPEQQ